MTCDYIRCRSLVSSQSLRSSRTIRRVTRYPDLTTLLQQKMDCLNNLLLLAMCCCQLLTSHAKNVYKFDVDEPKACGSVTNNVNVDTTSSIHEIDARYLSVAFASKRVGTYLNSPKLINLASALAPLELRLGGTSANFVTYVPATSSHEAPNNCNIEDELAQPMVGGGDTYLSASQWVSFNGFLKKVGWDLLFDVNNFKGNPGVTWDTTNFEQLLNDSSAQGINIAHFQLGNEPNAYWGNFGFTIESKVLAANFKTMKSILSRYPLYANSKICGPDVANVASQNFGVGENAETYLQGFLKAGAYDVIDEICLHHYNFAGPSATVDTYLSVPMMDGLKGLYLTTARITNATPRPKPVQLSETAAGYGGGTAGISDSYAGGFMWLDKLGLSAKFKATRIYRQSFIGAAYGLLTAAFDPNTDYFLSLVFKTLVEGPVFNVTLETKNDKLRLYANCASTRRYTAGALVVYYLNVADNETVLSLSQFPGASLDLYQLTPGDQNGLTSRFMSLNGNKLVLTGDQLPPLTAKAHTGDVIVAAKTYGFIVVPSAHVQFCVNYFANLDSSSQQE